MSGGSHNYIYSKLLSECAGCMYDAEMNDFIPDFAEVLHKLEWWQSGDTSEEVYREALNKFKAKWFNGNRDVKLKGYIDEVFENAKTECYNLIGVKLDQEK